jgi:phosphoglycerol transferase MdoB-like AlkP superfamily enzyme
MRFSRLHKLTRWLLWNGFVFLLLMTLLRTAFLFAFNRPDDGVMSSFWLGLRFDLRSVSLLLLPLLVLGAFRPLNPFNNTTARKGWMIYFGIAAFIMAFFYVVDFGHYAYLSQRLNASVLNYLEDAGISASMVWESYPVTWLTLAILVITALVVWLVQKGYRNISRSAYPEKRKVLVFIASFLIMGFFIFGRFNQYPLRWSDAFALGSDYKANLALNPFESFFNTFNFRSTTFDAQKVKESFSLLSRYYDLDPARPLDFARTYTPVADSSAPNIILVICESFSAYKSSMWNNPLNTTPFFDSLSRNGIFFDHCFTPSYGTARGVWATITGLPDVEISKTSSRNPVAVDQHTIIDDFNGYEKYYFIGGSPSWANIRGLLMNNIRNLKMYDQESFDAPRLDVWGISDKNLFLESNKILSKEKKPFFAVIQTADNHRPYTIPAEDVDFSPQRPTEDSLNRFGFSDQVSYSDKLKEYNAFRYTDYTYRKFIEAAAKESYFANTIFVFIGDHGIPGDVGEMFPRAWSNQRLTSLHVPLLFFGKGISPQRLSMVCSQVDVLPTIAGICKIPYTNSTLGRDLLDSSHVRPFAFTFDPDNRQTGIIMSDFLYRRNMQTGNEEIASLKNADAKIPDSLKKEMEELNRAVYESARYLLFNNKKKTQAVK